MGFWGALVSPVIRPHNRHILSFPTRTAMRSLARRALICGTAALLACSEESTGPRPVPTAITIAAGAAQKGTVGQALDSALAVFVTDKFGDPVPGVLVRFAVPSGHGDLVPVAQTTGPGGHASARWSMPTAVGSYRAYATASGLDSLVFQATAVPASPALLTVVGGDLQTGVAETAVDSAIVVLVQDGYGNPVSGANVSFVPAPGAGMATPAAARTDSLGRARTVWTLGTKRGRAGHDGARGLPPPDPSPSQGAATFGSQQYRLAGLWRDGDTGAETGGAAGPDAIRSAFVSRAADPRTELLAQRAWAGSPRRGHGGWSGRRPGSVRPAGLSRGAGRVLAPPIRRYTPPFRSRREGVRLISVVNRPAGSPAPRCTRTPPSRRRRGGSRRRTGTGP